MRRHGEKAARDEGRDWSDAATSRGVPEDEWIPEPLAEALPGPPLAPWLCPQNVQD